MLRKIIFFAGLPVLACLCGCMGGTSIVTVDPVPAGTEYQGRQVLGIIQAENRAFAEISSEDFAQMIHVMQRYTELVGNELAKEI